MPTDTGLSGVNVNINDLTEISEIIRRFRLIKGEILAEIQTQHLRQKNGLTAGRIRPPEVSRHAFSLRNKQTLQTGLCGLVGAYSKYQINISILEGYSMKNTSKDRLFHEKYFSPLKSRYVY